MNAPTGPFRKIAVATDFALTSSHAVTLASAIAKRSGGELTVVNVVAPAAYSRIGPDTATLERAAQVALEAAVIRVRDDVPAARGVLLRGSPADELVAFAEKESFDLVVTGTHGRTSIDRWLVGSVAKALIRSCHAPVLTVHDAASEFRHLLVATDLGPSSERAVEVAAQLAAAYGARITLLHALGDDAPADAMELAHARLEEIASRIREFTSQCDVLARQGSTWAEISEEAEKGAYDLVVIGTHDRSALSRWLHGSVAEKVMRASLPPVLSVRAR